MIKVFCPDKIIYLLNDQQFFKTKERTIFATIQSEEEMRLIYNELITKNNLNEIYFFNESIEQLFRYFSSMFRTIEAAGGLVKNEKGEWLFIFRNGKWDLPKGKIEKNESIETAAIREVEEECGITDLTIIKELPATYHTYSLEEKNILKRTYWFEMTCKDRSELIPQLEEGITEVKWLSKNDLKQVYENTYESVKEVVSVIG
jgi:ADP-ribose pyrophosphatase YjhB (NUDIX family)